MCRCKRLKNLTRKAIQTSEQPVLKERGVEVAGRQAIEAAVGALRIARDSKVCLLEVKTRNILALVLARLDKNQAADAQFRLALAQAEKKTGKGSRIHAAILANQRVLRASSFDSHASTPGSREDHVRPGPAGDGLPVSGPARAAA